MRKSLVPWRKERTEPAVARREENPFLDLHRRMNDLFDSFFSDFERTLDRPSAALPVRHAWDAMPRVDIAETEQEVVVSADLPGLDEKDVSVSLDGDVLTVQGQRKDEREEKKLNYHLVERSYGEFHRSIQLPPGLDTDRVKASFKKGVLTVNLPKRPEARARKKSIEIETA